MRRMRKRIRLVFLPRLNMEDSHERTVNQHCSRAEKARCGTRSSFYQLSLAEGLCRKGRQKGGRLLRHERLDVSAQLAYLDGREGDHEIYRWGIRFGEVRD